MNPEQLQNLDRIPRGLDFLTTVVARQRIMIPAGALGGRSDAYDELVTFVSAPLSPAVGNADTIMERLEDARFGEPTPTHLVAFANVSAGPLRVVLDGKPTYFDLYVTLSPTKDSPGTTVFRREERERGSFESQVNLSPMFELRPLGSGGSLFVDTSQTPLPGFPMRLGSTGGTWTFRAPTEIAVRHFAGVSLFYEGEVMISALAADRSLLAACAKQQAEFIGPGRPGRFSRQGFPNPSEFSNIELDRWRRD